MTAFRRTCSSVGGKVASPFIGAYVASKFALEGISQSLRRELMLYGIDVIVVGPGAVRTPMIDKGRAEDLSAYDKTDYAPLLRSFREYFLKVMDQGLPPERIGEAVLHALTTANPKPRYAVVPQPLLNWTLPRMLPPRFLDRMIARQLGMVGAGKVA